jgi:hypothetical protein
MTLRACLVLLLLVLPACSSLQTHVEPKVDLGSYRHIFVESLLSDGNGVDQVIARELRGLGYDATSGPLTMLPDDAEVVVAYTDRWNPDFANHMIALSLIVRTARTDRKLASAVYNRPSITGESSVELVDAVLARLFPRKPPGA